MFIFLEYTLTIKMQWKNDQMIIINLREKKSDTSLLHELQFFDYYLLIIYFMKNIRMNILILYGSTEFLEYIELLSLQC